MQKTGSGFLFSDDLGDVGADVSDEAGAEADARVVGLDGVLDEDDVDVRGVAGAGLRVAAEEVRVEGAASVHDVLEDHASGPAGALAASAEQGALEVVVVHAAALLRDRAGLDDVLDAGKEVFVDQGLVSALDLVTVVGDDTEVVAIPEHLGKFVDRDLFGGVALGGAGAEPAVVQLVGEVGQGVVAGGVQLEGQTHERGTGGVDGDGAEFLAVDVAPDVEVAQGRPAERAAVSGLVAHLVLDVEAVKPDLDFVEDVNDGLHSVGHDALAEVFLGGDEFDAEFEELLFGDGGVDVVAESAGSHVDHDIIDVALLDDPAKQPLEDRPPGDGLAGVARLDVLVDVDEPQGALLTGGGLAL